MSLTESDVRRIIREELRRVDDPVPDRLTIEQLAAEVPASVNTVRWWVANNKGPKAYKLGRRIFFDRADVDAWYAEQKAAR